jgi:glutamyl-Q tRNA(Asp) synthetase
MKINHLQPHYRGRFAPSPTGELHFGSLLAAMASYADARSHQGDWLLRIDDIDQARVVNHSDQHILTTLEQCGFQWDESVSYQSQCLSHYQEALQHLQQQQLLYPCDCSRKQIQALNHTTINPHRIYLGTCRQKKSNSLPQKNELYPLLKKPAIRLKVNADPIHFIDRIQNRYSQILNQEIGDFILYRRDQVFSYQLSVVVDDFYSHITHVVRGYDLLNSTPQQIYLQQLLAYPQPYYAHIPLAVNQHNLKLSKLSQAKKIQCNLTTLVQAAHFLGQTQIKADDFAHTDDFWRYFINNWHINQVAKMEKKMIMY